MQHLNKTRQVLLILLTTVLVGILLWPALSSLTRRPLQLQPYAGYLEATLLQDGGEPRQTDALVYTESGNIYLSAAELGRLLELSVQSGSFRGQPALLVRMGDACAAYLGDGTLLTYTRGRDDVVRTPSAGKPLLLKGQWLLPIEQVAVGFCCLPVFEPEGNRLTLTSFEQGLHRTVQLAASFNLSLTLTGEATQDRYLLDRVLPVQGEGGTTLLDRALGPLFPPGDLTLTRISYGFLQMTAEGLRGLFSMDGVQLLAPQYRRIDLFDPDSGHVLTVDTRLKQRLWKCMDGGILPLTEESYRMIGRGHLKNGDSGQVSLLGRETVAVSDDSGLWGVLSLQTGRLMIPCRYTAIGGYMDVGTFSYTEGSRSGLLSGTQEAPTVFFDGESPGIVVERGGFYGVVGLSGETLFYPAFDAIFLLPFGDRAGWYGRQGDRYTLMQALPPGSGPVLEGADLTPLSGMSLVLQQRLESGWWVADTATGASFLLPAEVAARLYGGNPVFTVVQVTERGGTLAVGSSPQPPYVTQPVLTLREGESLSQAALSYARLLLAGLSHSGGSLGLTDYVLEEASAAPGDRHARLTLTCTVTPQADPFDPNVGSAWGVPDADGRRRLTLSALLCEAVDDQGRVLLCAVNGEDGQALQGLPEPRDTEPAYRYNPRPLTRLYTELLAGAVEERVFHETEQATYIEARRLVRGDTPDQTHYLSEILMLDAGDEAPRPLFTMPESLGGIRAVAETGNGLLVSTWLHLFASSGQSGPFGLLTEQGFTPLLERAQPLALRDGQLYLLAQSEHGEGLYVLELADLSHRLLAELPAGQPGPLPQLQAITEEACVLAWPDEGGVNAHHILSIDRSTGALTTLFPQEGEPLSEEEPPT